MCFFKKTAEQKREENVADIRAVTKEFELIINMADGYPDAHEALVHLQDEVKFLKPSAAKESEKLERRILNALGDVKIVVSGGKSYEKIMNAVKDLEYAITARKAL